ncbi:MAG: ERF family protein [Candidatus Riflebacteria bacterium]|nr:ERF family protein [Candidatus Riflebacteria bacterium]
MEYSKEIGKISEALAKAQGQMKPAAFDASNPHFKSKYATLASIMEACRPALSAAGIAVMQGASVDPETLRVNVTTLLTHISGEFVKETLSIKPARDDPQSIGGAITYARKFSLAALLSIVADDDDDGNLATGRPDTKPLLTSVKKTSASTATVAPTNAPAATKTPVTNAVVPKTTTQGTPVKTEVVVVPAKNEPVQAPAQPEPPVTITPKAETPTQQRIGKIREIFTLSAKLGHSPQDMKTEIATILGWSAPLRESSQMTNDDLDKVLVTFNDALTARSDMQQEAA